MTRTYMIECNEYFGRVLFAYSSFDTSYFFSAFVADENNEER